MRSEAAGGLKFPQKLLCTEAFLAVANTGAAEVRIYGYDGSLLHVYGELPEPMGMACDGERLYVTCRGDGTVVRIEIAGGRRETVLEGLQAPSDLELSGDTLFVAEAEARIAAYRLEDFAQTAAWGDDLPEEARPSGISLLHDRLWFVDAERSALRYIEGGKIRTAVGEGLQHPRGVTVGRYGDGCGGGRIFIADTGNNKVKVYDPDAKTMMTLLDTLHGPGGIAKKGCTLYIADTNAHAVVAFDLPTMTQSRFL